MSKEIETSMPESTYTVLDILDTCAPHLQVQFREVGAHMIFVYAVCGVVVAPSPDGSSGRNDDGADIP